MLTFIILTTSFTMGILIAGAVAVGIVMNPKVLKWIMKKTEEIMIDVMDQP